MAKKKSLFRRMGNGVKSFTGKILGMRVLKPSTIYVVDMVGKMARSFKLEGKVQTFEEAVQQYKLTEEAIEKKKKNLLINCLLFLSVGLVVFLYGCFNVRSMSFFVFLNYFFSSCVMFVFAYRMHYYRFLIIQRRLDLTYRDWFEAIGKGKI